jgi:hypothetical protein
MIRPILAAGMAAAFALSLSGCAKSSNVSTQSAGSSSTTTGSSSGTALVPAGTVFDGALQQEINSKTSKNGDTFTLVEHDTLFHKNAGLHGAIIDGHLDNVAAAGLGKKPAMTIVFDDIRMPDGTKAPVNVQLVSLNAFNAKSHKMRTLGLMFGGAVAGHTAAKIAGKKHGGLLGAAGGYVLSQEMKSDIDVKPGTVLAVKVLSDADASSNGGAQ